MNSVEDGLESEERGVEIPAIAGVHERKVSARTIAIAAVAGVCLAGAGVFTYWSWQQRQAAKESARAEANGPRPASSTTQPKRLLDDEVAPPPAASAPAPAAAPPHRYVVPDIEPDPGDEVEPIGVRRRGQGAGSPAPKLDPRDAPVMLTSRAQAAASSLVNVADRSGGSDEIARARSELAQQRRELQGQIAELRQRLAGELQSGAAPSPPMPPVPVPGAGPGAQPQAAAAQRPVTAMVVAGQLADSSLVMPKGTVFTCSLLTRVVSAVSGNVRCILSRDVHGADGRVVLAEKGSVLDGEYQVVGIRPGVTRVPVLWTRLRTPPPHSVTVELESPATGQLGDSGVDGFVDNRWGERIGASLLLSLIDDVVKITIANQQEAGTGSTVVFGSNTLQQGSRLAEKVLDATITIPPLLYRNQGTTVGVYVRSDVDFRQVYALRPATER